MSYTVKHADGTGKLQRGWYAYNGSSDSISDGDRWVGPWHTERGALAAIEQAESASANECERDDELCRLATEAGKTPAMKRARESHEKIRAYME